MNNEHQVDPQVKSLQQAQERAYAEMYRSGRQAEKVAAYDKTVSGLLALLGEDAHCNEVDIDLFSFYSDIEKDRTGVRPGAFVSYKEVDAQLRGSLENSRDEKLCDKAHSKPAPEKPKTAMQHAFEEAGFGL